MQLDIRVDTTAIQIQLAALKADIEEKVVPRALNRTAITVRAVAARTIAADLGGTLKINEVRKALWIVRATRVHQVAIVRASGRKRIPLGAFKTLRETPTGVTVNVGGQPYNIPHAFILRDGNKKQVRIRAPSFKPQMVTDIQFRRHRINRRGTDFPIAGLYGPGVPFMFVQPRVAAAVRKVAVEKFAQVVAQEIAFRTRNG